VAESFRLADIARGSEVQRAMAASAARTTISDPALADLARREQDAQRRINALSDILQTLLAAPPAQQLPSVIAQMRKDVEGLTKERIDLKAQIEKRFPDYAELIDPKPVSITQVQSALRTGETLISIYLGEDASFVWAVPKSGAVVMSGAPLTMTQVGKTVEHLRKALDPSADSINNIPAFDLAAAGKLYEQLLKPVESAWKGSSQSLLIVPHGPLGQLPFAVLPTSIVALPAKSALPFEGYKSVPWLIRQATLTQLPSVTALTTLRKTPLPRAPPCPKRLSSRAPWPRWPSRAGWSSSPGAPSASTRLRTKERSTPKGEQRPWAATGSTLPFHRKRSACAHA
jgi:CHAT domain-containing protein